MANMGGRRIAVSRDVKIQAAAVYVRTGSVRRAAEHLGLGRTTIHNWIARHDQDWEAACEEAREIFRREMSGQIAEVLGMGLDYTREALAIALEAIRGPDRKVTMTVREAMTCVGIAADKYAIATGQPTSITARAGGDVERRLRETAAQLEALASKRQAPEPAPEADIPLAEQPVTH